MKDLGIQFKLLKNGNGGEELYSLLPCCFVQKKGNRWDVKVKDFFNCYFAAPRSPLGHSQGDSLTNPMIITAFAQFQPEGHWEPCNVVGSLSPTKHLMGFNQKPSNSYSQCNSGKEC